MKHLNLIAMVLISSALAGCGMSPVSSGEESFVPTDPAPRDVANQYDNVETYSPVSGLSLNSESDSATGAQSADTTYNVPFGENSYTYDWEVHSIGETTDYVVTYSHAQHSLGYTYKKTTESTYPDFSWGNLRVPAGTLSNATLPFEGNDPVVYDVCAFLEVNLGGGGNVDAHTVCTSGDYGNVQIKRIRLQRPPFDFTVTSLGDPNTTGDEGVSAGEDGYNVANYEPRRHEPISFEATLSGQGVEDSGFDASSVSWEWRVWRSGGRGKTIGYGDGLSSTVTYTPSGWFSGEGFEGRDEFRIVPRATFYGRTYRPEGANRLNVKLANTLPVVRRFETSPERIESQYDADAHLFETVKLTAYICDDDDPMFYKASTFRCTFDDPGFISNGRPSDSYLSKAVNYRWSSDPVVSDKYLSPRSPNVWSVDFEPPCDAKDGDEFVIKLTIIDGDDEVTSVIGTVVAKGS